VVVLGDSLLKFAGEECKRKGYDVRCFPGIRIEELRHQVEKIDWKMVCPDVIVIHAGTNNIRRGISATKIMGETMDLVDCIRKQVPKTNIVISGILHQRNVSERFIRRINTELDWLCSVRDCLMVDGNCWIRKFDIARDVIHPNRRGAKKFGNLFCSHSFSPSGKHIVKAVKVVEKNICSGLCKNTMQTSELQSPKI
jgi:hypothetical protein